MGAGPTIVTLNSWKCDGDYRKRVEIITRQALDLRPDILLLQEAFIAPELGLSTAQTVADALGYHCAIHPARTYPRRVDGEKTPSSSALAILTSGDILSSEKIALESDKEDGERISQIAEINLEESRILIVNTHLTYLEDADPMRQREMEQTLAALPDLTGYDLAVMGGDFNCPPDSPPMKWLLNDAPIPVTEACQASGLAFNTIDHDWTDGPAQIDYLCKIGGGDYRFGRVRRTFDVVDPEHDILPSDHYGIWTKFVK
jgi:endonuclease/exonuclease/phosphatase family metal-dependent hydrolase